MSAETLSRWARRFVALGAVFLVAWSLAAVLGVDRRVLVVLGLYGFVLHTVFGKAYSLVPTYFDRDLSFVRAPVVHLPLSAGGTAALAAGRVLDAPVVGAAGGLAWALGTGVFLATILWTVRDNLTGAETGTSEASADRRPTDRIANAFVPVALLYLGLGAYETLAVTLPVPSLVGGYAPAVSHLLGAGAAGVVLFAVGFRLLPRFTVAHPPRPLVWVVLPAGAAGPAILALSVPAGPLLPVGAAVESVAVVGFAATVGTLLYRSDRSRVGFYGVLSGGVAGVAGVALGAWFALGGLSQPLVEAHYRLNLLGFLGLTIVGVAYQFYPPNVGSFPGANDRTALGSILAIAAGLGLELLGAIVAGGSTIPRIAVDLPAIGGMATLPGVVVLAGRGLALVGALLYAGLVLGIFHERYRR